MTSDGKNLRVRPLVRYDDFFYFGSEWIEMQCRCRDMLKYFSFAMPDLPMSFLFITSRFQAECNDGYPSKVFVLNQQNVIICVVFVYTSLVLYFFQIRSYWYNLVDLLVVHLGTFQPSSIVGHLCRQQPYGGHGRCT